jgi:5'-nucleotidase, C-terminal domain
VLAVVDDMTPAELKAVLEQAYSELPDASGGFLQVSNMTVTVDFDQAVGSRVTDITVDTNGTPVAIVTGGAVVSPGTLIDVATNSFSAGGGDSLPFPTDDTTTLGLTDQQTVSNYLTDAAGLNGLVTAAQYPEVAVGGGVRLLISGTP